MHLRAGSLLCFFLLLASQAFSQQDTALALVSTGREEAAIQLPATTLAAPDADDHAGRAGHNPDRPYFLNYPVDLPIMIAGTAWTLYAFKPIYSKENSSEAQILALDKNDLSGFDRWATRYYSEAADASSNYLFYGSIPVPFLLFLDKNIRRDAVKISALYLEAMAITGTLYTAGDMLVDRYRPLAYNPDAPMKERVSGIAKNSFFAGHVALVGTATFYTAAVYDRYHSDSWTKWLVYGAAAGATLGTAYLRLKAGRHFPSDIVVGTLVGVGSGLLVPYLHRNKNWQLKRLGFSPLLRSDGVKGISLAWRL